MSASRNVTVPSLNSFQIAKWEFCKGLKLKLLYKSDSALSALAFAFSGSNSHGSIHKSFKPILIWYFTAISTFGHSSCSSPQWKVNVSSTLARTSLVSVALLTLPVLRSGIHSTSQEPKTRSLRSVPWLRQSMPWVLERHITIMKQRGRKSWLRHPSI